jgi:hypothetical protein
MPLGATNLSLVNILAETGANTGTNESFKTYNSSSWAQGPAPGLATESFWGSGVKSGGAIGPNILYNPYANGAQSGGVPGVANNYRFGFFQNYYGYMDGSNYLIELYVQNTIPPAGRGDPFNNVDFDVALQNAALNTNSLAPIFAGNVMENGGTFGPQVVSNFNTFNVNYFYINGGFVNNGLASYDIEIYVNSSLQYQAAGIPGQTSQPITYNDFTTTPLNSGNGFLVEVYFLP